MSHTVITYVDASGNVVSAAIPVEHNILNGYREAFVHNGTEDRHQQILRSEDEGITWMRGYYAPDSKQAECMKVAHALSRDTDPYADNFIDAR